MDKPRKSPGNQKGSVNNHISDIILNLLNNLKNKPENKGKDQFQVLKNFLEYYDIDGNNSLLEELNKTGTISFDMVKDDGLDIDQIIGDDRNTSSGTLHNLLNNPSLGTIGKEIEKITITELVKKAKDKLPVNLQTKFDKEVNNPKSLNEFKSQVWNFFEYGGIDDDTKNEIKKIKITNKEIVDGLINEGKLQANDISGDYKNRNITHKKTFDKIITQEYIGGLKDSVNKMENNLNILKDTFTNLIPNMGWITDKYPFDKDQLDPEILKKIDDVQEKGNKQESDKLSFDAYIILVQKKNKKLGDILSKLFKNHFDFSKLDFKEQNELLNEIVDGRLNKFKKNGIANLLEIDQRNFDEFIRNIFDLDKKEIIIPCAGGDIKLGVNKIFKGGDNPGFVDINDFAESRLPIEFDIKILEENKDLINNSALKNVFASEMSADGKSISLDGGSVGKLILMYTLGEKSFDKKNMKKENVDELKKTFDLINKKNDLNKKINDPIINKDSSINKKKKDKAALLDARERFKDEQEPEQKSWANFLHYLKENEGQKEGDYFGYEGTDMEVEGNNLIIKGEEEEEIEETSNNNGNQESTEKQEDQFLNTWKNIRGYNFLEDKENFGFVKGTRLWIKFGDTELPPLDIGGDQWIQLEIKNITNNNFTLKLTGGELSAGNLEGKEFSYPKTKESLEMITNAFDGYVYKLPGEKEWDKAIGNIKAAGIDGLDGINVFDELKLESGKLQSSIIEGNPEITHFGSMETLHDKPDPKNKGKQLLDRKTIINYEVIFNSDGTIDVSYNNYKRNMDYNNFLLFISTKKLKPKTKADVDNDNKEIERGHIHSGSKFKFFGVANIWHMVTGVGKKLNEGIKKQIEKQDKKFYNIAIGERGIANKLNSVIGRIPGVGDALENIDTDFQNNKDKETRDKTEEILKKIEGHNDFGAIFTDKNYLNEILGSGTSLRDMVLSGKLPGGLSGDKRFVASALLLAQINKGPGPYEKIETERFKGVWVRLLLGEPYYSKFMADQKEIMAEMKAKQGLYGPGYDAQLASDFAKAEMTFLINNIGGRAPGQRLGCIETGEFKSLDGNAKRLWSDKFSGELDDKFNNYMSRTKVEEGSDKLGNVHNFTFAYIEYRRFLIAGKPTKSLPYLKKMAQLAKSPDQIRKFKGAITYAMLSGFLLHHTLPSTQVRLQGICRSFGFSPGLWAPHIDHQKKIAHFLEVASGGTFYKGTSYKLSDFDLNGNLKYEDFIEKFEPRWENNSNTIDEFLNKGMYKDDMNDPTINQLKESSLEAQEEDFDQDVSKNSKLISNYPLSLTKGTIRKIKNYRDGYFEGKDNDEIQRSQDAWKSIAKAIPKGDVDKGHLVYITKRFLNRFDGSFDNKKHFARMISTVQNYKNKTESGTYSPLNISGNITKNDVRNILVYAIKGKIIQDQRGGNPPIEFTNALDSFESMLRNNIEKIDSTFIEQVLGKDNVDYFGKEKSYVFVPRGHYQEITQKFSGKLTPEEEKLRRDYKNLDDKYINISMVNINTNLKRSGGLPSLIQEESGAISHPDLI